MDARVPFRRNDWPTMGVEIELQLVDAETMALKSAIAGLLDELPALAGGGELERGLHRIETADGNTGCDQPPVQFRYHVEVEQRNAEQAVVSRDVGSVTPGHGCSARTRRSISSAPRLQSSSPSWRRSRGATVARA